jgi:hypothetical protein
VCLYVCDTLRATGIFLVCGILTSFNLELS